MNFSEWVFHYPVTWIAWLWIFCQLMTTLLSPWMKGDSVSDLWELPGKSRRFNRSLSVGGLSCMILWVCERALPSFRFDAVWIFLAYISAQLLLTFYWTCSAIQHKITRVP